MERGLVNRHRTAGQPHQELFQRICSLRADMRAGDALVKTLGFLEEYVAVQFNAEESYMRRFNYSGSAYTGEA